MTTKRQLSDLFQILGETPPPPERLVPVLRERLAELSRARHAAAELRTVLRQIETLPGGAS